MVDGRSINASSKGDYNLSQWPELLETTNNLRQQIWIVNVDNRANAYVPRPLKWKDGFWNANDNRMVHHSRCLVPQNHSLDGRLPTQFCPDSKWSCEPPASTREYGIKRRLESSDLCFKRRHALERFLNNLA
jgi:hypothetical protein